MRYPYAPPIGFDSKYFTADELVQFQQISNNRYKGVEWETVTEQGRVGRVHVTRLYVDDKLVEGGEQGLVAAMENRLGG